MKLFRKILIANRGEIALRIMHTCTRMGISTVAIYSDADADALFVKQANEAIRIGGTSPTDSYLNMDKVIAAAHQTGADAIHPGYGFLSENAPFAQRCSTEGIVFIGPNAHAIDQMGSKRQAKLLAQQYNVPTIPGYQGIDQSIEILSAQAHSIGFPVLLKASAGGGGKGMRIVRTPDQMIPAIEAAKREALSAFGDDVLLIEKYFDSARHIEFQIMGDQHGNIIHCFERECSIQRRYQKIIEESPSVALTPQLRQQMGDAAIAAARSVGYDNAGTVEFILVPDGKFYFLEVNTRLQVEHPVTEMITGLDLVQLQIEVAQGQPLTITQQNVSQTGHAIEVRLYAEDAANNYLPATGTVSLWHTGNTHNVRYDTGIATGSVISIYYDPMIAKIITHAPNRVAAIRAMQYALQQLALLGITNNKELLLQILANPDFVAGNFDTHFLTNQFIYDPHTLSTTQQHHLAIAALLQQWHNRQQTRTQLTHLQSGWRNLFYQPQAEVFLLNNTEMECKYVVKNQVFSITIANQNYKAQLISNHNNQLIAEINQHRLPFSFAETVHEIHIHQPNYGTAILKKVSPFPDLADAETKGGYRAPMPGEVVKVLVKVGDVVKSGDGLLVLSSMKMENTIEAAQDGTVEEVFVTEKSFVEANTLLIKLLDK
jgi:acetyl-CoA carboxylase biotin carboxylase subunit